MATENSINLSDPGVISYDGAGTFTGSVITQHDVLVGGAANAITSISPSTTGFVLTSNGVSADPSFLVNPGTAAIKTINVQTFTITGVYTPLSGMKYCLIEMVGGGGGGGGVTASPGVANNASGGSGACYIRSLFTSLDIGASQIVTIGAFGNGGPAGVAGFTGGVSSVGALISANGGIGGPGSVVGNVNIFSISGSTTALSTGTGTVIIPGGNTGTSINTVAVNVSGGPTGTNGGDSYFGRGGIGIGVGATAGTGYGSGGSGASNAAGGDVGGANGTDGIVIITEYIA